MSVQKRVLTTFIFLILPIIGFGILWLLLNLNNFNQLTTPEDQIPSENTEDTSFLPPANPNATSNPSQYQNGLIALPTCSNGDTIGYNTETKMWNCKSNSADAISIVAPQGSIIYRDSNGWTTLNPGETGQYLITRGSNQNPYWGSLNSSLNILTGEGLTGGGRVNLGGTLTLTNTGVTSLNEMTGNLTLRGTSNQIAVTNSSGIVTLSLPQDISTASSPIFGGITLGNFNGVLLATNGAVTATATTSNLPEGSNLYYTDERTRNALNAIHPIIYDPVTGEISFDTDVLNTGTLNGNQIVYGTLGVYGQEDAVQMIVRAYSTQTNNLQEWQDSSGNPIASIDGQGNLSATSASITGSNGTGFINLPSQSADPSTPVSGVNFFADANGNISWIADDGFKRTFDSSGLTADRNYILPDVDGTIALVNSSSAGYVLKTGDTMTGALDIYGSIDEPQLVVRNNGTQTNNLQVWQNSSGTSIAAVSPLGYFGIGSTNPDAFNALKVETAFSDISAATAGIYSLPGLTISSNNAFGFTGTRTGVNVNQNGFNLTGAARGIYSVATATGASGTVSSLQGIGTQVSNTGGGAVSAAYGVRIISGNNSGGGTIGTLYGLYIESQTAGTDNYALYSAGGLNYFANNVGIGVTNPTERLEVNGNIKLAANGYQIRNYLGNTILNDTSNVINIGNGATIRTVIATGLVGIGTTSPAAKVDIVYDLNSSPAFVYGTRSDVNSTGVYSIGTASIYGIYGDASALGISTGGTQNIYGGYFTASGENTGAGTSNAYGLYVNGATGADNNYSAIFVNGNVGIADTSPASLLSVGNGDLFQVNSSGNIVAIGGAAHGISNTSGNLFFTSTGYYGFNSLASTLRVGGSEILDWNWSGNTLNFAPHTTWETINIAGGSASTGCTIINSTGNLTCTGNIVGASTGNQGFWTRSGTNLYNTTLTDTVGIGTSTPNRKLTIKGITGATNTELGFQDNASATIGTIGFDTQSTNDMMIAGTSGLRFMTGSTLTANSVPTNERMRILANGNVGIGETNPSVRFQVQNSSLSGNDAAVSIISGTFTSTNNRQNTLTLNYTGNSGTGFMGDGSGSNTNSSLRSIIANQNNSFNSLTNFYAGGTIGHATNGAQTGTNLAGFFADLPVINHASSALTNYYGLTVNASSNTQISNKYGVYVGALSGGSGSNYAFYAAGSTQSYFGGNVGIGTNATPGYLLDVLGSGKFRSASRNLNIAGGQFIDTPDDYLALNATSSRNIRMVEGGGNVGIGVSPVTYKLQVAGNVGLNSASDHYYGDYLTSVTSASNELRMYTGGGSANLNAINSLYFNIDSDNNATNNNIIFGKDSVGLAPTELMRIQENGNVGIGTNNPLALFHTATTATSLTANGLSYFDWSPSSASTFAGDLFTINLGANGNVNNILNITNGGASLFSISQSQITANLPVQFNSPGDVAIAYDLLFTNQVSSTIKSKAPLTIEAGELFESNDLTLRTYNSGAIVLDSVAGIQSTGALKFRDNVLSSSLPLTITDTALNGGLRQSIVDSINDLYGLATSGSASSIWSRNSGSGYIYQSTLTDRVGIGTSSPQTKLHVANDPGGSGGELFRIQSTNATVGNQYSFGVNALKRLTINGGNSSNDSVLFTTSSGIETFFVGMSGFNQNVAVGTSSPTSLFQVNQQTTSVGTVSTSGTTVTGSNTQFLNTFKVGDTITVSGETRTISAIASNTSMTTDTWTGTFTGQAYTLVGGSRFNVLGNGNIGIGTTAPERLLQINNSTGSAITRLSGSASGSSYLEFAQASSIRGVLGYSSGSSTVQLAYGSNFDTNSLAINSSGNVGIGTVTQTAKLQVNSTSTTLGTNGLSYFDWSPGSAASFAGDLFGINLGANGSVSNLFNISNAGSSLFSVSQSQITANLPVAFNSPGDIAFAYDLIFTNPSASNIKSSSSIYIQAGEVFNSSDLNLKTFNAGSIVLDTSSLILSQLTNCSSGIQTSATGVASCIASDANLKDNVQVLSSALNKVMNLRGVSYNWKDKTLYGTQTEYGLIAQEVEAIVPDLVFTMGNGVKGVKYQQLTGLLIEAMKEQQVQIINLQAQLGVNGLKTLSEDNIASYFDKTEFPKFTVKKLRVNEELIAKSVKVIGDTKFYGAAEFNEQVALRNKINVGEDSAGKIKLSAGQTKVSVQFQKEYSESPIVTSTPLGLMGGRTYAVVNITKNGFEIEISSALSTDIEFNWIALGVTTDKPVSYSGN